MMHQEDVERTLELMEFYAGQLKAIGQILVEYSSVRRLNKDLVEQAIDTYQLLAIDVFDAYAGFWRVFKKHKHSLGDIRPRPSLEALERAFIIARDACHEAEREASKLEHSNVIRAARIVRKTADNLRVIGERTAHELIREADRLGRWTKEWERELGLRGWLR